MNKHLENNIKALIMVLYKHPMQIRFISKTRAHAEKKYRWMLQYTRYQVPEYGYNDDIRLIVLKNGSSVDFGVTE